jgi:RNA polymerase sigma factor FliA
MGLAENSCRAVGSDTEQCRAGLIDEHLGYVKRIVQRMAAFLPPSVDVEDLINAGIIGLLDAADRYEPDRDNKFTTYAAFRIKGSVLSELRSRDFLSRSARRKVREFHEAGLNLIKRFGREATDEELASELRVDIEELHRVRLAAHVNFVSWEEIVDSDRVEQSGAMETLKPDLQGVLGMDGKREMEEALAEAIEELSDREKTLLSLYYWDELTMKEIDSVLDVTESRVSQLHSQVLGTLRGKLSKAGMLDSG